MLNKSGFISGRNTNKTLTKKPFITRIMAMSDSNKTAKEITAQRAKEVQEQSKTHLSPIKHRQQDFFIADIFDALDFRVDLASMELPLFALKAGDIKTRHYEHKGVHISIRANEFGLATIHDKDLWIYAISKLVGALNNDEEISRTIHFTVYDYLVMTNRATSGAQYDRAKKALERLKGTTVSIQSENKTDRLAGGFGLIDDWTIVEKKDGRMVRISMTLPRWLYRSIIETQVKKISPDYFRLRKPLDRRTYELASKHCGNQKEFKITLDLLHKKSGSTSNLREFKRSIKSLVASNDLPDYFIQYDEKKDMVIFTNRNIKSLLKGLVNGISKHK